MKIIVKIFLILGILFWSTGLILSLSKLIAINGLGKVFQMEIAPDATTLVTQDSIDIAITYTYKVSGKKYSGQYKMFVDYYNRCNVDTITIKYNEAFPMISYIDGIPLKNRQHKTGIAISSFFLLFILLVWKYSNRNKWVNNYKEIGNRPWLYPNDITIKNPWKRLINRLFQK